MAKVPLVEEQNAQQYKTIRPSNWFVVRFSDTTWADEIRPWMATDVSVQEPVHFQKVGFQVQGRPFSRPVLKENDGYEFTITFEETTDWKVQELINTLERLNIDSYGRHNTLKNCQFTVEIASLSPEGYEKGGEFKYDMVWTMCNSFFVGADDLGFSYNSPGKITRKLTFCCNRIVTTDKRPVSE